MDDPGDPPVTAGARFRCDKPALRGTAQTAMRRLTRDEYLQTLGAVLGQQVLGMPDVQRGAAQVPSETNGDLVKEFQNGHAYDHVEGILVAAQAAAKAVAADVQTRDRIFGECAAKAPDAACAASFLDGYGRRVLKRPLTGERRQRILEAFAAAGGGVAGLELILARLLQAPEAVFHLELPRQTCTAQGTPAVTVPFAYDDPNAFFFDGSKGPVKQVVNSAGWYVWELPASRVEHAFTRFSIDLEVKAPAEEALLFAVNLNDTPLLPETAFKAGARKLSASITVPKGTPAKIGVYVKNATAARSVTFKSLQLTSAEGTASDCSDEPAVGGKVLLDDWSVASRLAYALTGEGPDDELLDAAARGELRSTAQLRPHARRLLATPAARRQLEQVVDSWLHLGVLPTPTETIAKAAGIESDGLSEEARRELLDYTLFMVLDREADAQTLLTARVGFPRSERMAKLYGSALASGSEPVELKNGHGGLLLRIAPLLSGQHRTSPITRGVYVRKRLMCDELPSPDFSIITARTDALEASDPAKLSAREITTEITSPPTCMGCHASINPIGFALEQFDPVGRPRTVEVAYTLDGVQVGSHPIDATVERANLEEGGPQMLTGAADLMTALGEGGKLRACIAERLYTHAQMRVASDPDSCALADVELLLRKGASVKEAWLSAVVHDDIFFRAAPELAP